MMNKLKNRRWGLIRDWTEIHRDGGSKRMAVASIFSLSSRGYPVATVKTSLLIQICNPFFTDARECRNHFENSHSGKFISIFLNYQ